MAVPISAHGGGHIAGGVGPTKSAFDDSKKRLSIIFGSVHEYDLY